MTKGLRKILRVSWTAKKTNEWVLNKAGVMLRSIGKQSGESVESVLEKKRNAAVKDFAEKEGLSLE